MLEPHPVRDFFVLIGESGKWAAMWKNTSTVPNFWSLGDLSVLLSRFAYVTCVVTSFGPRGNMLSAIRVPGREHDIHP